VETATQAEMHAAAHIGYELLALMALGNQ